MSLHAACSYSCAPFRPQAHPELCHAVGNSGMCLGLLGHFSAPFLRLASVAQSAGPDCTRCDAAGCGYLESYSEGAKPGKCFLDCLHSVLLVQEAAFLAFGSVTW